MKITMAYVYSGFRYSRSEEYALRFIESFHRFPASDIETMIVLNDGKSSSELACLFASLPRVRFVEHDDTGWDIGAFQKASRVADSDVMLFMGSSIVFRHHGWLNRVKDSVSRHGDGLYGAMGNSGNIPGNVWPHIRTTGFWMLRETFNAYPKVVSNPQERYPFEHGKMCLSEWTRHQGKKVLVVTSDAEYEYKDWDTFPNGLHRGDQSALLFTDRLTEPPFYK